MVRGEVLALPDAEVHRPDDHAALASNLCAQLAGPPGASMFTTPLTPNGKGAIVGYDDQGAPIMQSDPPSANGSITHYIASGMIDETFGPVLADPATMFAACQHPHRDT
jgi:hypothetical protein